VSIIRNQMNDRVALLKPARKNTLRLYSTGDNRENRDSGFASLARSDRDFAKTGRQKTIRDMFRNDASSTIGELRSSGRI
jgi:hypothetical protein